VLQARKVEQPVKVITWTKVLVVQHQASGCLGKYQASGCLGKYQASGCLGMYQASGCLGKYQASGCLVFKVSNQHKESFKFTGFWIFWIIFCSFHQNLKVSLW